LSISEIQSEEEIQKAVDSFRIGGEVGKAEQKVNYGDVSSYSNCDVDCPAHVNSNFFEQ
jgi:hypothetical protein